MKGEFKVNDFNLSTKDKHSFAKEFTTVVMQSGMIAKSPDPVTTAKHVAAFYNTLVKELDKANNPNA